jgi:hypothetical protein
VSDIDNDARPPTWNGAVTTTAFDEISKLTQSPPCPRCGVPMRLARLEPHPRPRGHADDMIYECSCGQQLTRTIETK